MIVLHYHISYESSVTCTISLCDRFLFEAVVDFKYLCDLHALLFLCVNIKIIESNGTLGDHG